MLSALSTKGPASKHHEWLNWPFRRFVVLHLSKKGGDSKHYFCSEMNLVGRNQSTYTKGTENRARPCLGIFYTRYTPAASQSLAADAAGELAIVSFLYTVIREFKSSYQIKEKCPAIIADEITILTL